MNNKKYDISAKPTNYNGILYRSRLEARWAAFFDFIRFEYEYEPEPFETWSPDFTVHTIKAYVEIKPFGLWDEDLIQKLRPYSTQHRCGLFSDEITTDKNGFYLGKALNPLNDGLILKDFFVPYYDRFNQENIPRLWLEAKNKTMYLKPKT